MASVPFGFGVRQHGQDGHAHQSTQGDPAAPHDERRALHVDPKSLVSEGAVGGECHERTFHQLPADPEQRTNPHRRITVVEADKRTRVARPLGPPSLFYARLGVLAKHIF
mgnify:CR=1 FL=1